MNSHFRMIRFQRFALTLSFVVIAGCSGEPAESVNEDSPAPSVTQKTLNDLQAKYDQLAGDKLDNPVQWATDDLENIGDWEYKVVELGSMPASEWEAELNTYGDERWEVVWIDASAAGKVVVFKRPSVSLLSKIPLSQFGRMMIGDSSEEQ